MTFCQNLSTRTNSHPWRTHHLSLHRHHAKHSSYFSYRPFFTTSWKKIKWGKIWGIYISYMMICFYQYQILYCKSKSITIVLLVSALKSLHRWCHSKWRNWRYKLLQMSIVEPKYKSITNDDPATRTRELFSWQRTCYE